MTSALLGIFLAVPAQAAFDAGSVGTAGGVFLKLPAGARAAAMGEAQAAAADDASAVSWNPAALTRVGRNSAVFQHAEHLAGTSFEYAAYAHGLSSYGVVGLAVRHFSAGRIVEMDATGTEVGSFTPRDIAVSAAYAKTMFNGISAGAAVKYIHSSILASARTATVDFGVLVPAPGWKPLSLGLAVADLGGSLKYESVAEKLPTTVRVGVAWRAGSWTAAADGVFPRDNGPHGAFGFERRSELWSDWRGALRVGLNSRTWGDIDGFSGVSFGLGLGRRGAGVDYAFVPFGGMGSSHLVSLRLAF